MDFSPTLNWLQNLVGNQQGINQGEFGQGIGLQTSALGQQGSQFNANLALQKVIADWQNQLANRAQTQSEQGQQFGQNFATKQYADTRSGPTVGMIAGEKAMQPAPASSDAWISNFLQRFSPKKSPINFYPAAGYTQEANPYGA
jgi:hypothetical protein